jgi:hypothetical protein
MAINIIDGFYVGSSTPIDSRFVVANSTERTAIEYKYDGLKVFQRDTRETYIWNSTTSIWDLEGSGALSGTGTLNYVPRWVSGSSLGTSSLYSNSGKIGINDTNPLSYLQIKDISGGQPLSFNSRYVSATLDSAVVGYNWYWNGSDQSFDISKKSSYIEMTSQNGFLFKTRSGGSSNWVTNLELNNVSSGWNVVRSSGNGTFISGTLSLSSSTSPTVVNQMVTFDGSFRTLKSIYKNSKYLTLTSNYSILTDDNELIIKIGTIVGSSLSITLPTITASEIGREITIVLLSSSGKSLTFTAGAQNIKGLDDNVFTSISGNEAVKFTSVQVGLIFNGMFHIIVKILQTISIQH